MRESPFYDEIAAEGVRDSVKQALELRFGTAVVEEFRAALDGIVDRERLSELNAVAIRCRRIAEFRRALTADTAAR